MFKQATYFNLNQVIFRLLYFKKHNEEDNIKLYD